MKKYCKNHPNIPATHFIEVRKRAKGFHGPANLVTKIWLCDKCYFKTQTDLLEYMEKKEQEK